MVLTQDFKNECERIIKAWHPLIQYWYEKGSSYKDLSDFIDKNSNTVLTDPFFLSFKTTRTFEEIKWMSKRINEYYIDSTPTGLYFYISGIYNAPKDNKEDVQKLMHNYHLLRARFFRFINEGGLDNVSKELDTANTAKATAETALKTWTDNFGTKSPADIKGNQEKHTDADLEKHKPEDLKPADYDAIKNAIKGIYPNYPTIMEEEKPENIKKYIKGLEDANTKLATDKTAAETAQKTAEAESKTAKEAQAKAEGEAETAKTAQAKAEKDAAEHLKAKEKAEQEAKEAKEQASQGTSTSDKALSKLLAIYKEEITKRTELFYQELSLDNNWINEKYGNRDISYLELLNGLTADSEPKQVINAFKIIALIKATEKAQEANDKYKDRLATLPANLKKNNLNKFLKVKETWDLITEEPKAENNPLYLPIITQKKDYITKLNNIITLWQ